MIGGINPYRRAVSPYLVPIPVPLTDPDTNAVRVNIGCEWLNIIVGALAVLEEQATWDTEDEDEMSLAIQRAGQLRSIISVARAQSRCNIPLVEFACDYHFNIDEQGWDIFPPNNAGVYVAGTYWQSTFVDSHTQSEIKVQKAVPDYQALTAFSATYVAATDGAGGNNVARLGYHPSAGGQAFLLGETILAGSHNLVWEGYLPMVSVASLFIDLNGGDSPNPIWLTDASLFGLTPDGTVPC